MIRARVAGIFKQGERTAQMGEIVIKGPFLHQGAACEPVLRCLPDWFGIEDAVVQYLKDLEELPTFLAAVEDRIVGFLTLKPLNNYVSEILVMAVRPEAHRSGVGRALCCHAEAFSRQRRTEYLYVKTLGPSNPDPGYARTRAFYEAMGFRPLEEFTQIWDEQNPCLLMVKSLAQ
jgi:ribosomal protein S18 acetylase RimI-like enzyme